VNIHFNRIGRDIIKREYNSVFRTYNDSLEDITKAEFESLPSSEYHSVFQDEFKNINDLPEEDQELRLWATSSRMMFTDRLSFLEDYCKTAVDKGHDGPVTSVLSICSDLINESIEIENKQYQGFLLRNILDTQKKIHDYAVEQGMEVSFLGIGDMGTMITSLHSEDVEEVGEFLLTYFTNSAVTAVENDVFRGIYELGVLGRSAVEDYPELAIQVIDALQDSLEVVDDSSHKDITREMIVKELESIHDWRSHGHAEINARIEDIYDEFDIDIDETQY
jgi:hypothetical protein